MLLKEGNGDVHIHEVNNNGSIGTKVYDNNASWSSGWTSVTFYQILGKTYLMLLKNGDGDCHIHRMNSNGTVGFKIYDNHASWSSGWTTVQAYTSGAKHFIMLLKEGGLFADADVHIHQLNLDGTLISNKVVNKKWSKGWTSTDVFSVGTQRYLFIIKEGTGQARIHMLRADGSVGTRVGDYEWSSGWTSATSFQAADGRLFRVLLKEDTGLVHFDMLVTERPYAFVQLYQHRGTPDAKEKSENTVAGFKNAIPDIATAGLEIDLVFDGNDWRVGHNKEYSTYPLFSDFMSQVAQSVFYTGKKIMLEIKRYEVNQERFDLIDTVIANENLKPYVKIVSFNWDNQLKLFAKNGYEVGIFVHANNQGNDMLTIDEGIDVISTYFSSYSYVRAYLLLRWGKGSLSTLELASLEETLFEMNSFSQTRQVQLGFTGLTSSSVTVGEDDAGQTQDLASKILAAKLHAGNRAKIVAITNHPHAYMTNALK